ncbi:hypothetical protein Tco_0974196 [Tanacetum coccineum]|uniref:Uncharacterized protein n=1 Tax=Tanacetum coccineum TaxID=301880 RepID=A0ABQ5EAW8_9ASTR
MAVYSYFLSSVVSVESGLGTHSSSEVDPLESSPPPVFVAPMVSPFLHLDDSESDIEIPERHVSPTTSIPEIHTAPILPAPSDIIAPSSEFPLAPVVAPPGIRTYHITWIVLLWLIFESIRLRIIILAGHRFRGHSLLGHSPPDTTVANSSTPPRFIYPPLAKTPWCSEAYLYWRSLATTVTSSIHANRALVPSRADLLPPHNRFRDSISPEDNRDVEAGVDAGIGMEVDVRVDIEDEVESSDRGTMEVGVDVVAGIDIPDEIPLQRIEDIETRQKELGARSLIDGGKRASLLEQVTSLERSNARLRGTMMMERARADRFWRRVSFMESELRQIRRFCY